MAGRPACQQTPARPLQRQRRLSVLRIGPGSSPTVAQLACRGHSGRPHLAPAAAPCRVSQSSRAAARTRRRCTTSEALPATLPKHDTLPHNPTAHPDRPPRPLYRTGRRRLLRRARRWAVVRARAQPARRPPAGQGRLRGAGAGGGGRGRRGGHRLGCAAHGASALSARHAPDGCRRVPRRPPPRLRLRMPTLGVRCTPGGALSHIVSRLRES